MPSMPRTFRPRGAATRAEVTKAADARRGSAYSRGYNSRWAKASRTFLSRNPLCAYCALRGFVTAASCTDHLYPHRWPQYEGCFWRTEWWVASCDHCHSGFKQSVERQGPDALDDLASRLRRPTFH